MEEERDLRVKRNEETLQELPESIRKSSRRIMGIPKEKKGRKEQRVYSNSRLELPKLVERTACLNPRSKQNT